MHVHHSEKYIIEHIYCLQICTSPPLIFSFQLVSLPCLLVPATALISSSNPSQWGGGGRECANQYGGISISFKACMTSLFCIVYDPLVSPLTSSPFLVFLGVSEEYVYFPQICADSHFSASLLPQEILPMTSCHPICGFSKKLLNLCAVPGTQLFPHHNQG